MTTLFFDEGFHGFIFHASLWLNIVPRILTSTTCLKSSMISNWGIPGKARVIAQVVQNLMDCRHYPTVLSNLRNLPPMA